MKKYPKLVTRSDCEFQCVYCGHPMSEERDMACCGEVHGEWVLMKNGEVVE